MQSDLSSPWRKDFPFFQQEIVPVYFDNAATTQKPLQVLDRLQYFYAYENANIARGSYELSNHAYREVRHARTEISTWLGCSSEQLMFTRNATEALNFACALVAGERLTKDSNVIVSQVEHNSAWLPWLRACRKNGAQLRFLPLSDDGGYELSDLVSMTDSHTVAAILTAGANINGWRAPLDELSSFFADNDVIWILDATQRLPHEQLNFSDLGADFLCFSGHKLYGPLGIGGLVVRPTWLNYEGIQIGGGTVQNVSETDYQLYPGIKGWEAGTLPIAEILGLAEAIRYLEQHPAVVDYEESLRQELMEGLQQISGIQIIPSGRHPLPIVSFTSDSYQAADLSQGLANLGFCLRVGHHCANLAADAWGGSILRASLAFYNTHSEIQAFLTALSKLQDMKIHR